MNASGTEYPDTNSADDNREEESVTPRPTRLSGTLAAALIVGGIGCSPRRRHRRRFRTTS